MLRSIGYGATDAHSPLHTLRFERR
ncbi:MAG: hypothetical protein V7606_569, partial [Burkholderiales bacterium]